MMLDGLGTLVERWGVRDFEFELWEGELMIKFCRLWLNNPFGGGRPIPSAQPGSV